MKDAKNRQKGLEKLEKALKSGRLNKKHINNRGYNKYLQIGGNLSLIFAPVLPKKIDNCLQVEEAHTAENAFIGYTHIMMDEGYMRKIDYIIPGVLNSEAEICVFRAIENRFVYFRAVKEERQGKYALSFSSVILS